MAYLDEEFLLQTDFASRLYHNYAEKLPLIDYHCHVSPAEIARDRHFADMTEAWLEGDH
ncbi:MAG: glucuronate isomerase, partial [Clostridia bacterium]|nr:glucuronate isomerase [Clostridia bacterium]